VWRKTSGSCLCYSCGRLNRVDAAVCFYCGRRNPGLWGLAPVLGRVLRELAFARLVTVVCVAAYGAAILLEPGAALRARGVFDLLAPSNAALLVLGMTGSFAWHLGWWWTLVTAIYLHGSLLHIVFNLLWIHQLAPAVGEAYGQARLAVIFTAAGVIGFVVSNVAGVPLTIGASGAVFGLLGAMVRYGRSRGGVFGMAVFRQYWHWSLVIFVMGFLMPGVNNLAHAGGFLGGYLAALVVRHEAETREGAVHRLAAVAVLVLTAACFVLAISTAYRTLR